MNEKAKPGLLGKHPGYGDFLQTNVDEPLAEAISGWLDHTLSALRDAQGQGWAPFWDGAQDLRFWVGRAVLGRTVVGILRPSADRVGRRYPLVILLAGADVPPPQDTPDDQDVWDQLAAQLEVMEPGQGARALLAGFAPDVDAEDAETAALGPTIWAHHPEADIAKLLAAAGPADAARATVTRSYWWATGGETRAATWLGCAGLPDAGALGWALAGVQREEAADGG